MSFHQFSESTGAILVREDEVPPDRVEGGVPEGWELTGEVLDIKVEKPGEKVEVYVLERKVVPAYLAHLPYFQALEEIREKTS